MIECKVYHLTDLDNKEHWCENGCSSPKGSKKYIDAPSEYNPAYWCDVCVTRNEDKLLHFVSLGPINKKEYNKKKGW